MKESKMNHLGDIFKPLTKTITSALTLMLSSFFLLLSCSTDAIDDESIIKESGDPIVFSTIDNWNDGVSTRGDSMLSFKAGDKFGVFAYYLPNGKWDDDVQEFMLNQEITFNGSGWSYSPVKYWPKEGNVVFTAYYPYERGKKAPLDYHTGKIIESNATVSVKVNNDPGKQKDILVCPKSLTMLCSERKPVSFEFKHAMSRITFSIKSDKAVTVKRITVFGKEAICRNGMINVLSEKDSILWSNITNDLDTRSEYDFYSGETLTSDTIEPSNNYTSIMSNDGGAFLIPQDVNSIELRVIYEYDEKIHIKYFNLETLHWESGHSYNYRMDLSGGEIQSNDIPSGYTAVEYLVSDKEKTTPINLGLLTNGGKWGVKMILSYSPNTENKHPIGLVENVKDFYYKNRFYDIGIHNQQWHCGWGEQQFRYAPDNNLPLEYRTVYTFEMNYKCSNSVKMKKGRDDTDYIKFNGQIGEYTDSDMPIYIFGIYKADVMGPDGVKGHSTWSGRIYETWISRGEEDIMHLIPCESKDSVIGLFDLIGRRFYPLVNGSLPQ